MGQSDLTNTYGYQRSDGFFPQRMCLSGVYALL